MSDRRDIEAALAELGRDEARPLPAALRDRIEAALLAETAQPLQPDLHDRLTEALTDPALILAGIDAPRPLPTTVRADLERALTPAASGPRRAQRWLAVAAAVVLVGGIAAAASQGRRSRSNVVATRAPVDTTSSSTTTVTAAADQTPTTVAAVAARGSSRVRNSTSAQAAFASRAAGRYGSPPPFSFPSDVAAFSAAPVNGATTTSRPPQATVTVAVVGGDPAQEAGFKAYIRRLNDAGGAGGHRLALVTADASHPAKNAAVTVNLSSDPITSATGRPAWVIGPVLETLHAPESVLKNDVFGFASAPERQAHLIADTLVPPGSNGITVAIYRMTAGLLSDRVPNAMADVVQRNGGRAVMVAYDGNAATVFVPADVVLLSLDAPTAATWCKQARNASYRAGGGIGAIYPAFDSGLLADAPAGLLIESPFTVPSDAYETTVLRTDTNRGLSSALIHGWVTAKALAVAVWERDATTAPEITAALAGLDGFADAWTPPYAVRPGTRSRTPEGVLLEVSNGGFSPRGGFRKDPY